MCALPNPVPGISSEKSSAHPDEANSRKVTADMPEAKQKNRRQIVEEARRAALDGNWDDAIEINKNLLERDPKDSAAYNRLGRAYLEKQDYATAYEAYS